MGMLDELKRLPELGRERMAKAEELGRIVGEERRFDQDEEPEADPIAHRGCLVREALDELLLGGVDAGEELDARGTEPIEAERDGDEDRRPAGGKTDGAQPAGGGLHVFRVDRVLRVRKNLNGPWLLNLQ